MESSVVQGLQVLLVAFLVLAAFFAVKASHKGNKPRQAPAKPAPRSSGASRAQPARKRAIPKQPESVLSIDNLTFDVNPMIPGTVKEHMDGILDDCVDVLDAEPDYTNWGELLFDMRRGMIDEVKSEVGEQLIDYAMKNDYDTLPDGSTSNHDELSYFLNDADRQNLVDQIKGEVDKAVPDLAEAVLKFLTAKKAGLKRKWNNEYQKQLKEELQDAEGAEHAEEIKEEFASEHGFDVNWRPVFLGLEKVKEGLLIKELRKVIREEGEKLRPPAQHQLNNLANWRKRMGQANAPAEEPKSYFEANMEISRFRKAAREAEAAARDTGTGGN